MRENFILQIILNMAAHDYERLANVIEEDTAQKGNQQNQKGIEKDSARKHSKKGLLETHVLERPVNKNVVDDQVNRIAHQGRWNDLKHVGDDHKEQTEQQVLFVSKEVFIEVLEFFHEDVNDVVETKVFGFGSFGPDFVGVNPG